MKKEEQMNINVVPRDGDILGSPFPDILNTGIPLVEDFFKKPLDSIEDEDLKKVIATGTIIVNKRNGPKNHDGNSRYTDEELAQIIEGGVSAAKVAYKVAKGEIEPVDAVDRLVDAGTAAAGTVITTAAEQTGATLGATAGAALGNIFGPAGAAIGAKIGNTVGRCAGRFIGEVIIPGVKKVAGFVKDVAHSAWEGIKDIASNVVEGVSNFFSGVGDFFSDLFCW
jgi:hypothetical protein